MHRKQFLRAAVAGTASTLLGPLLSACGGGGTDAPVGPAPAGSSAPVTAAAPTGPVAPTTAAAPAPTESPAATSVPTATPTWS